jgi:hypothetical protein
MHANIGRLAIRYSTSSIMRLGDGLFMRPRFVRITLPLVVLISLMCAASTDAATVSGQVTIASSLDIGWTPSLYAMNGAKVRVLGTDI